MAKGFNRFWQKKSKVMQEHLKDTEIPAEDIPSSEQETSPGPEPQAEAPPEDRTASPTDAPSSEHQGADFATLDEALAALGDLQLKLRTAEETLKAQQEQNLRLQADFVNFRKRKERETSDMIRFANQDLIRELLPVLDNFDRTLDAIDKTDNLAAIKEGIALVDQSMKRQLQKIGLEAIEAKGKPFDSEWHEAITTVPVPDASQQGVVIDEIEKGYKLKERVIRFAKVVIGE